jgi:HemK-like putative methylase
VKKLLAVVDERLTGRPLWYIVGDADFYGYTIKVDERVLIPRPETEELALQVVGAAEEGFEILDMCTGSGAIAITINETIKPISPPIHPINLAIPFPKKGIHLTREDIFKITKETEIGIIKCVYPSIITDEDISRGYIK